MRHVEAAAIAVVEGKQTANDFICFRVWPDLATFERSWQQIFLQK